MEDAQTVIQEIANQLGMAVDQAGQFIITYLPSYAGLKTMQAVIVIAVMVAILLLLIITAIVLWKMPSMIRRKRVKMADKETERLYLQVKRKEEDLEKLRELPADDPANRANILRGINELTEQIKECHRKMNQLNRSADYIEYDDDCYVAAIAVGVIAAIFLIITLITIGCQASEIVGWQSFPEAKLIEMALKAVGQ